MKGLVLTITQPPEGEAEHGKTIVSDPVRDREGIHKLAYWALRKCNPSMHPEVANRYAGQVMHKAIGEEAVETSTGLRFRIDQVERD